jgi:hypothetical protein
MKNWIRRIERLGACEEALEWCEDYDSFQKAWQACERGDWMLWLMGKKTEGRGSEKRKLLVLASCKCARLALPYVKAEETRPLKAIETAEAWAKDKDGTTLADVWAYAAAAADADAYAATAAAYAAAYAATAANAAAAFAAAYAADAAYYAAEAADANAYDADAAAANAAANAADADAYAAYADAYAADADDYAADAAYADARKVILKQCADIVREYYPEG